MPPRQIAYHPEGDGASPTRQPAPGEERRDDELSKKLIRQAASGGEQDIMSRITSLMSDAQDRLVHDLDPGSETQEVQQRIVSSLDEAIRTALQQRSPVRARQRAEGERRELPRKPREQPHEKKGDPHDPTAVAGESVEAEGDKEAKSGRRGPFQESRRGWGHLPKRDREELLQGVEEEFIELYRPQIEQYYRALTETEEQP